MKRFNITTEGFTEINFEIDDEGEYVLYEDIKDKMNINLRNAIKTLFFHGRKYPDCFLEFKNKEALITFLASFYEFLDKNTYNINDSDKLYYVDAAVDFVQEIIDL